MFFSITNLIILIKYWGITGMVILYLVESMGLPAPIELPFAISGFLLATGKYTVLTLIFATWISTSIGNLLILFLARTRINTLYMRIVSRFISQETIYEIDSLVHRYGVLVIIFTRWINWFFGLTLWVCSLHKISPKKFALTIVFNNLVWSVFWVYFGGWIAENIASSKIHWSIIFAVPAGFLMIGYIINVLRKKLRRRSDPI